MIKAVALPLRLSVPVAGLLANITVMSAVNVSSPGLVGVPLLLQAEMLLTPMPETVQVLMQDAGAVPVLAFDKVHIVLAEKVAVRAIGPPSAIMCTPVKVCVLPLRPLTATEAMPSPLRLSVPVAGGVVKVTVTLAVNMLSAGLQAEMFDVLMAVMLQEGGAEAAMLKLLFEMSKNLKQSVPHSTRIRAVVLAGKPAGIVTEAVPVFGKVPRLVG